MTDKYKIDSHKLIYHVHRVSEWLNGKIIYPIYMEISPSGNCNHRCGFCSVDFMGYQKRILESGMLKKRLEEMGQLGVKSIMYAGEGEPFLNKEMADIVMHTRKAGIDVAITTNGVLMNSEIIDRILGITEWIKVSCNAGTADNYARIHKTKAVDFEKVLANLRYAARLKKQHNYRCALGVQILLLPENSDEIITLAKISRDIGVDYMVVKPYTHHHLNRHQCKIEYAEYRDMAEQLKTLNTETFSVVYRQHTMEKWDQKDRPYSKCLALPFWSYIDAGGNVWGCSAHLKEEKFLYGNIWEESFKDIWEGQKRKESLAWVAASLSIATCKLNCRMDEVNRYLWDLKNLPEHVNFI